VEGGGLQLNDSAAGSPRSAPEPESLSAEERYHRFLRSATPTAVQLARLLSFFNPPSLQAMKLIRAAAGLTADTAHEAEVVLGGLLHIAPGRAGGLPLWIYRFYEGVPALLQRTADRDEPQVRRFSERFHDYLRRRHKERAGIAGVIPIDSGDSAIRALEDWFLDLDENALLMILDNAEDLIPSLHQLRIREGSALLSRGTVDGRTQSETPAVQDDSPNSSEETLAEPPMMPTSRFYQVGGTLWVDVPSYVERAADTELDRHVREGEFCYVLTTRQMGKSSLMVRMARRLKDEGKHAAIVDLSAIGSDSRLITADQWYYSIADAILDKLDLEEDLEAWWDDPARAAPAQRLVQFFRDVVLRQTSGSVVIFVDDIESTLSLPFADDFFAAIRSCYNARAEDPEFRRLSFVLLGVASPSDLISESTRTPFNIGKAIHLIDFTLEEAQPLAVGLGSDPDGREMTLRRILYWTDGHPYLTQKICNLAVEESGDGIAPEAIDRIVEREFFTPGADRKDDNLKFVRNRLSGHGELTRRLLHTYRRVLRNEPIKDDPTSPVHAELKLAGVVKARDNGSLAVRNRIYARVFGEKWIT
jgi:hypothetical protein